MCDEDVPDSFLAFLLGLCLLLVGFWLLSQEPDDDDDTKEPESHEQP